MKALRYLFFLLIAALLFTPRLYSKGFFISGQAGYAAATATENQYNFIQTGNSIDYQNVDLSHGRGLMAGITAVYLFTDNFGAELGISGFKGLDAGIRYEYAPNLIYDHHYTVSMFRLNPSLVFAAGFKKIDPYARVGFLIGKGHVLRQTESVLGDYLEQTHMKYYGNLALGFTAACGAVLKFTDRIGLFAELNLISSVYSPSNAKKIYYTLDGEDLLAQQTVYESQIVFVDSYTKITDASPDDNRPDTSLKITFPMSSFGASLGLRVGF